MRYEEILTEAKVLSSWIAALDYQNGNVIMTLGNGNMYTIRQVPVEIYEKWMAALSKGKFWHSDIKSIYKISRNI